MEKETLYKFFAGNSTTEEKLLIKEWAESSPVNQKKLIQERKLYDMMGLLVRVPVQNKRPKSYFLSLNLWRVASVCLLLLSLYLFTQLPGKEKELSAIQTISVPAGQRINIDLPDGTNVWLNSNTTFRYPVNFGTRSRVVELDGEAWFDVTPSDKLPFHVQTSKGSIKVLGTTFNVEAYSADEIFETTLIKGSVEVSGGESGNVIILQPGYKSVLTDGCLESEEVLDYDHYRWREGLICFRNEPFTGLIKVFEKYYGNKIEIRNEELLRHAFTGKFRQTEGIDHALRVLQRDLNFTYTRDDENQLIFIQ